MSILWLVFMISITYAQTIPQDEEFSVPVSVPTGYVFEKSLPAGGRSADVAYLQLCLSRDPELAFSGSVNGLFDRATFEAVVKFQEKYTADILMPIGLRNGHGIVSKRTRDKLNETCGYQEQKPTLDVTVEPANQSNTSLSRIGIIGVFLIGLIVVMAVMLVRGARK